MCLASFVVAPSLHCSDVYQTFLLNEQEEDCKKMVAFAVSKYGGLSIAFNNAGVYDACEFTKIEDDMVSTILDTNVKSIVWLLKYEVRRRSNGVVALIWSFRIFSVH